MYIDDRLYDNPEFKRKMFAVDETVMNLCVDRNRPFPTPANCKISRFENGLDCDEVFPGIFVGNAAVARNKEYLTGIGISHVLNCAHGHRFNMVATDEAYYHDVGIKFKGLKLDDTWMEDISRCFEESTLFIDNAISSGGKVFVHCLAGISRSATIAIAYIMMKHNKNVESAVKAVRRNRTIRPNEGFLRQLVALDFKLNSASQ